MGIHNRDYSEFEGGGVMPNTVFPMGEEALTASDKLRLQSITGQETDSRAAPNPYHWIGGMKQDPELKPVPDTIKYAEEADRYRENPY